MSMPAPDNVSRLTTDFDNFDHPEVWLGLQHDSQNAGPSFSSPQDQQQGLYTIPVTNVAEAETQPYYAPYLLTERPSDFNQIAGYQYPYNATSSLSTSTAVQAHPLSSIPSIPDHSDINRPSNLPFNRRLRVPQNIRSTQTDRRPYFVEFTVRGSPGVRVRDVLKDRARIDRSDERVFESTGVRQIRLVISWPGYSQSGTYIPVQDKNGFITRGRLAMLISLHLSRFVERASKQRIARGDRQWEIGRRGICLHHLWLLSVTPARRNIWIAEIEIQM